MRIRYALDALFNITAIHTYDGEVVVLGVYHGAQLRPGQDS